MNQKIILSSITACAVVGLVGCGGGSSSTYAPEPTAKVTGVAVDDLILNGVVEAKNLDTVLANGRTSSTDGSYSLNLDYSGVVTLQVSCKDGNATMLNIDTKAKTECPTDVQLRSIAEVKEGVEQNVSISPITEVVVARAEELAGGNAITSDALKQARSDIGQLFGIDPIASSPTDGTYKTIVDAIHEVAKENNKSVMDITKDLAEALKDGKAENEDVIIALVEEMNDANVANLLTDTNGTATAVELDNVEDLALAKALIKELRTEVVTASEFIDDEIVNIEKDVDSAIFDTEYMASSIDDILRLTFDMVDNGDTSNSDTIDGKTYEVQGSDGSFSYTISDSSSSWSGTLNIPEALLGDDAEDELNKEQQLAIDIQGDVPLGDNVSSGSENKQTVALAIKTDRKSGITSMSITGKVSSNGSSIEIKALDLDIKYADVDDISSVFVSKFALEGVVGSHTINGTLNINDYIINDSLEDNSDFNNEAYIPSSLTFEGSITNTQGSSLNGNLSIKLDNAKTIDLDSDDEPLVTASFNGTLAMKDRPALITNLSYKDTLDKDKIVNNINLSYTYGSTVINSTVVMDENMENGHILVSSQNGVQADLTIENEDIKDGGKLTKDGELMGTFEHREDAPVVKYIDGYFETLF